jgi:hypothetical protein
VETGGTNWLITAAPLVAVVIGGDVNFLVQQRDARSARLSRLA